MGEKKKKKKVSSYVWQRRTTGQFLAKSLYYQHGHLTHLPVGTSGKPVNRQIACGHCSIVWMGL